MTIRAWMTMSACWLLLLGIRCGDAGPGPLRVSEVNPRYFTDNSGRAVYLTGSHTWANLVDMGPTDPPPAFDFDVYLDFMEKYGHNFMRLWAWELLNWDTGGNAPINRAKDPEVHTVAPHPWARTGPGTALDGKPNFDLTRFDGEYFRRLRTRVEAAQRRGIYVAVMLFEGWGIRRIPNAWENHPFHPSNRHHHETDANVSGDSVSVDVHDLADREITALQEAYVRKVIDTVNDLDNVLYEIGNECQNASEDWQYHMIRFIKNYEAGKPKQHPVGMTAMKRESDNAALFNSPADWISPDGRDYRNDPPAESGRKVVVTDTDHLWGIGGNQGWVWKSFCRGLNPIFMDPYDGVVLGLPFDPRWEPIRVNMGYTRRYAERMDLIQMTPQNDVASSGYCLANPGHEYLVYAPDGGDVVVDLADGDGEMAVEWFDPNTGETRVEDAVSAGAERSFTSPFGEADCVLYLKKL